MSQPRSVFLSAEWRDLVMLNYEVESRLLDGYVPPGTVLDSYQGRTYLSLVGFRFFNARLLGAIRVPFHGDFLEVNLRFYVRGIKRADKPRGVVFISEIVPKHGIAAAARLMYGEKYTCLPMRHRAMTEGLKKTAEYNGELAANGASSLPRPRATRCSPKKAAWNNSLPNTTGVIPLSRRVAHSSIGFRISLGEFGLQPARSSLETAVLFTVASWGQFFSVHPIVHSSPRALPLSSTEAKGCNEIS
jgi:Uncharacterized conserved protein (COG2071)